MELFEAELLEKIQETDDSYSFKFKKPEGYNYKAGQHAMWMLKDFGLEGDDSKRIFTIASHPDEDFLMFTTRIADPHSAFKEVLLNKIKKGDKIYIANPLGKFHFGEDEKESLVIVGGIGITPIRSLLIEFQKSGKADHQVEVYYSDDRGQFAYEEKLKALDAAMDNVKLTLFSDRNKFTPAVEKFAKEHTNEAEYLMAGSPGMNKAFTKILNSCGVDNSRVVTDNFKGYE